MTEVDARTILKDLIMSDGSLMSSEVDHSIQWWPEQQVYIQGKFSPIELEAIVWWVRYRENNC